MLLFSPMIPCLLAVLFFQLLPERAILEVEDSRAEDVSVLIEALKNPETRSQRLAARAMGRLARPQYADRVVPLLSSPDPGVRKEAVNALGQMGAGVDLRLMLQIEKDPSVRGVVYETMGRWPQAGERLLARGLEEENLDAKIGAAKGLESFFRRNAKTIKPAESTIRALRTAIQRNPSPVLRQLALLTLNAAGDADPDTLTVALEDPNPLVRRLAVMASRQWREDPSPIVRYESLKVAGNCELATKALDDPSDHVALLAVDLLGNGCSNEPLEKLVNESKDWRRQSRALVSLAKVQPDRAKRHLDRFAQHGVWQARTYAAAAAKILKDKNVLSRLLHDPHPNVVASALVEPRDAIEALKSNDYGLIMEATRLLKSWSGGRSAVAALLDALKRVGREQSATSRDPRRQLLERLREFGDQSISSELEPLLSDFDPVIAQLAAEILSEKTGRQVEAKTKRLATRPVPSESFIRGLLGSRARVTMREAGPFSLELIPEEAPVTAATFVQLAEKGYYNGLTFHRIVPNFVVQGGSPGANEYVGTPFYIRDELGLVSHLRGTVGISTRGRDTGDSQIFINLVDNFRLDHNYTVFARVTEGMEHIDEIQEGDTIESIEIIRKVRPN